MKHTFFSILFVLFFSSLALSQTEQVSLAEIFESTKSGEAQFISNKSITAGDLASVLQTFPQDTSERYVIPAPIIFQNCEMPTGLRLAGIKIPSLSLISSELQYLDLSNCDIDNLYIDKNTITANLLISEGLYGNPAISNNSLGTTFEITDNRIKGSVNIGDNFVKEIYFLNNHVSLDPGNWFDNYVFAESTDYDFHLIGNTFVGDSSNAVILSGDYLNLRVVGNTFGPTIYFSQSGVGERFLMAENDIQSSVSFEDFLFSETRNEIYWGQMANYKLAYSTDGGLYRAQNDEELADDIKFKNLISNYKILHNIFLGRGDLESANACYDEMKELQGRKLRYIYKIDGTFANFFRWQLNRLLKVYTNHGTDPALAVVISFYVILVFSFLYLFFPSEWDRPGSLTLDFKGSEHGNNRMVLKRYAIHFVNALTLSINSFVTLGFGSIPTKGLARYLCIIEGFLGWFLLSIFTVALINQVLA